MGRYAFVGAGEVVAKNLLDHVLMPGIRARRIGWMCIYREKLVEDLDCAVQGSPFEEEESRGLKTV